MFLTFDDLTEKERNFSYFFSGERGKYNEQQYCCRSRIIPIFLLFHFILFFPVSEMSQSFFSVVKMKKKFKKQQANE